MVKVWVAGKAEEQKGALGVEVGNEREDRPQCFLQSSMIALGRDRDLLPPG